MAHFNGWSGNARRWLMAAMLVAAFIALANLRAQDAAPSSVNLQSRDKDESTSTPPPLPSPEGTPTPIELPPREAEPPTPAPLPTEVPELSTLDEAFKKTSLGKTADEFHQRIEIRRLQNKIHDDETILNAKKFAESARTDLEKRERLRDYYKLYYGRLRSLAGSEDTRKAIDAERDEKFRMLDQPRVRPAPGATIPPPAKPQKTKKPNKYGRTR